MFDARLEINIYRLLQRLGHSASAWIGADIKPSNQTFTGKAETTFATEKRSDFVPIEIDSYKFLDLRKGAFIEKDSQNKIISRAEFEYIVPQGFSKNTAAAIPFLKTGKEVLVGIEFRDLPAPQRFTGNSNLACVPAWRLPKSISHKFEIETFLQEKFSTDFGVEINKFWELGGSYFTSAGITPEIVYPAAIEIRADKTKESSLRFFTLEELTNKAESISDAHLLILLNRLKHALR